MLSFVAGPRTAGDDAVLGVLRQLAADGLSVEDAVSQILELSATDDFDGEVASEAVLIAAEATGGPDVEPAKDRLLALLVDAGEDVVSATSTASAVIVSWSLTERTTNISPELKGLVAAAP